MTAHLGIPITSPLRTLLDLADVLDAVALARAVNEARLKRLIALEQLEALLARSAGRRAVGRLRPFLDRRSGPTRSVFEDEFLTFADRYGLPRPEVNQRVAGYEVDMLWRAQRLIAELDGRTYHEDESSFEHDRNKDVDLLAAGYRVVRITWDRLMRHPEREAGRLRALLAESPGRGVRE